MSRRIKTLCSLAVLMALLAAQVMGLSRGYWCECVGAPAPVASPVCLPAQCHAGMEHTVCCPESEGASNAQSHAPRPSGCPEQHGHKFLTQEADFQAFTPMAAPLPLFVAESYALLPPLIWLEKVPLEGRDIPPVRRDGWSSPPPMAVTELRIQEMLI
ncbi:MAG: hypothetical protein JWM59_2215 [Verrucomicrobiales bacterium]|nr:hypothetical protein [Verrucomicrobiales bacterium]